MPKMFIFLIGLVLIYSCRDAVSETTKVQDSGWEIETDSLPKMAMVDAKAQLILDNWKEFAILERSFNRIYTTEFREDFVLTVEELVENQKKLENGEYPEAFDIPQIKGRQKVFKTYVLKTKGDLEYRQNPKESILEMIAAFNNLRNQFNVVMNNTLPEELRANENN